MYEYTTFLIHSSVAGYLVCFYILAVVYGAVMNIHVQAFVWTLVFILLGLYIRTRVAVSYSSTVHKLFRNQRMTPLLLLKRKTQQPKQAFEAVFLNLSNLSRLVTKWILLSRRRIKWVILCTPISTVTKIHKHHFYWQPKDEHEPQVSSETVCYSTQSPLRLMIPSSICEHLEFKSISELSLSSQCLTQSTFIDVRKKRMPPSPLGEMILFLCTMLPQCFKPFLTLMLTSLSSSINLGVATTVTQWWTSQIIAHFT